MASRVAHFQALADLQPDNELFRFSLAQALVNREYRALVGVFLALLLLALKAAYDAGLL